MMRVARVFAALGVALFTGGCAGDREASLVPDYTVHSPDGVNHQSPRYSPDGSLVAWWAPMREGTAGNEVWVANADDLSGARALGVTSAFCCLPVVWSPDGTQIAAISNQFGGAGSVVIVPVAGGDARLLTQGAGFQVPTSWHPRGDRIAFYASAEGGTLLASVVSVSTGTITPLIPGEMRPHLGFFSPDGSKIAYNVIVGPSATLWVADSVGGNPRQLTTEGFEWLVYSAVMFDAWSPDGKELLYESRRTGTGDIWVTRVDSAHARQLTRDVRNDGAAAWSPDGNWVAFRSDRGRQTDIWVVSRSGDRELRVTDSYEDESAPVWRPGTSTIAFVHESTRSSVFAMDVGDGTERRLTDDSVRVNYFTVSSDGSQVAYVIHRGATTHDLAVGPSAGGALRTIVAGGGDVVSPAWSPDDSKLVFLSERRGSQDPWVVDVAPGGGAPRQAVAWPGFESGAWWSRDGASLFVVSDRDSRLGDVWRVPLGAGDTLRVTTDGSIGGTARSYTGTDDFFAGTITGRDGALGVAHVNASGVLRQVWTRGSALTFTASPSGDSLALTSPAATGAGRETHILSASGTGARRILDGGEFVSNWSHDGNWILYTLQSGTGRDLGMVNRVTGEKRRLTTTPEDEAGPEWLPDNKTVVFRRQTIVNRISSVDMGGAIGGGGR